MASNTKSLAFASKYAGLMKRKTVKFGVNKNKKEKDLKMRKNYYENKYPDYKVIKTLTNGSVLNTIDIKKIKDV